ncbi:MAG TPA: phytanoyl-CoA dioxygenase family protein [Kofleriaceae bacterium]|nr:phytanoyl-CoA dioxygenase family protein [Kofleriaceae bacterium]
MDDASPRALTDDDRAFFAEHGWLVVRGVVAADRVAALEAALDELIPAAAYPAWGDRIVEAAGVSAASAALAAQVRDPAIAGLAGALLGAARVQLLQDTVLIKPAASTAALAWHQDYSYLTYLDRPALATARLALTPCTEANGCLRVIDGSHTWGLHGDDLAFRLASIADTLGDDLRERARDAERTVELAPGDVSFHHCLTFHGSRENRSERARKTLALRLFDGACKLLVDRLPSPQLRAIFTADDDGHLTGPQFPVLWRRA